MQFVLNHFNCTAIFINGKCFIIQQLKIVHLIAWVSKSSSQKAAVSNIVNQLAVSTLTRTPNTEASTRVAWYTVTKASKHW